MAGSPLQLGKPCPFQRIPGFEGDGSLPVPHGERECGPSGRLPHMATEKDPRARFRAEIVRLGRWRTLARTLVPLHALLLVCLCLWVGSWILPGVPSLPLWACLLPLPLGLGLSWFFLGRRSRLDIEGLRDLLRAALEVEEGHPFAGALALQAEAVLKTRRRELLGGAFREARRPRPWYLLYAVLAFLLLLEWTGPLPLPFPLPGKEPRSQGVPLARAGRGGQGLGGGAGKKENRKHQGAGRDQGGRSGSKKENKKPPRPRAKKPLPRPGDRGIRPRSEEKILFTPPPSGKGPMHMKKVYETEGAPFPPGRKPGGDEKGPKGKAGKTKKKPPGEARKKLARALERAAEKALGDGLLSPGEAWLASRMAEAWKR